MNAAEALGKESLDDSGRVRAEPRGRRELAVDDIAWDDATRPPGVARMDDLGREEQDDRRRSDPGDVRPAQDRRARGAGQARGVHDDEPPACQPAEELAMEDAEGDSRQALVGEIGRAHV